MASKKLIPQAQLREVMTKAIRDSKRRFEVQNKEVGMLDYANEARFALQAISNNPRLLDCDPETLTDSIVHLAAMGLSLNPAAQQAVLIPRWNSKKHGLDCTASPQYRGLMKLATDTGLITNITADVVFLCDEDKFDVDLGSKPYLNHRPKLSASPEDRTINLLDHSKNRMFASYCIAHLRDSEYPSITVMDLTEIMSVANASEAFNPRPRNNQPVKDPSGPWVYWSGEMIKKSVIRRASKQWPLSDNSKYSQLLTAIQIDNTAEANEQRSEVRSDKIESDMGEVITADQIAIVKDLCQQQNLDPAKVYGNYQVNSISKIKAKDFDEVNEKLLDRLRRYNDAQKAEPTDGDVASENDDGDA